MVRVVQARPNRDYPLHSDDLAVKGVFNDQTKRVVEECHCRSAGLTVDGIVGPAVLTQLGLTTSDNRQNWTAPEPRISSTLSSESQQLSADFEFRRCGRPQAGNPAHRPVLRGR